MANIVDPDQTAPLGATLSAQTCVSESLDNRPTPENAKFGTVTISAFSLLLL